MENYDFVVFADTGSEWPETYKYLEQQILPFVKERHIDFSVVKGNVTIDGERVEDLETYLNRKKQTPSRQHRWCTDKFKIRPIRAFVKQRTTEFPATAVMGISFDEVHRIHDPHWPEYVFEYPLVEKRFTRLDCENIIKEHGFDVPPKSGCFYCPFQRLSKWEELYRNHPDLYGRARKLEEQTPTFPKYFLASLPLARLAKRFGDGDRRLDEFMDDPCDSGFCMT